MLGLEATMFEILGKSPDCYMRFPEMLAAHGETIRVLHRLIPVGVATNGSCLHHFFMSPQTEGPGFSQAARSTPPYTVSPPRNAEEKRYSSALKTNLFRTGF